MHRSQIVHEIQFCCNARPNEGGRFQPTQMTKQEIVTRYEALDKSGKDRIGRKVKAYLKSEGFHLTNAALHFWRKNDCNSHLERFYIAAYRFAFDEAEALAAQN